MIAKLPGVKNRFMGDNLEMICLFQAAEIERLIDNLDDYRLRYLLGLNLDIKKLRRKILIDTLSKSKSSSWPPEQTRVKASRLIYKNLRTSSRNRLYLFTHSG